MISKASLFLTIICIERKNRFTFATEKGNKAKQIH